MMQVVSQVFRYGMSALDLITLGPMEKVCANAGRPVFANPKKQFEVQREKLLKGEKIPERGFFDYIKDFFAWGDVLGILGLIGWAVTGKFIQPIATEQGQQPPTLGQKIIKWLTRGLTFGGFGLARLAQFKGIPYKHILGEDKYAQFVLDQIEAKTGKKIFEDLDVNKLILQSKNSNQEYNKDVSDFMKHKARAVDGMFSGFLYGPSGTGKTSGIKDLCGKWAETVISQGNKVRVKQFNFEGLESYIEGESETLDKISSAAGRIDGEAAEGIKSLKTDPLTLIEIVLNKIDFEKEKAKQNGEKLVIVLDEVDKIFPIDELQGVSQSRLKRLLMRFQNLVEEGRGNVWMASNFGMEYFERIPVHHEAAKAGLIGRLKNMMCHIDLPDKEAQSRITANYLLSLSQRLGQEDKNLASPEKIFDGGVRSSMRGSNKYEQRKRLAVKTSSSVSKFDECNSYREPTGKKRMISGRNIMDAITNSLRERFLGEKDEAKERGKNPNSVRVSWKMIKEVIASKCQRLHAKAVNN